MTSYVLNYVDPVGFLGGKERIRLPTVSIHSLKRHIIEYTGLKAESQKRGLGSPILQGSKACALNNDNNN